MKGILKAAALSFLLVGVFFVESVWGQSLTPEFTLPDSGCFGSMVRHDGTGEIWVGTYGGRIFVRRAGTWQLHTDYSSIAESIYRMVYHQGTNTLYANLERLSKAPSIFRLNGDTWVSTGYGNQYPESEKTMGLGMGIGADGYIYAGVGPYLKYTNGYVWRSIDGINWSSFTSTSGVGTCWAPFGGQTYATTTTFSSGNFLKLSGSSWNTLWSGSTGFAYLKEFKGNLYATGESAGAGVIYRWNGSSFNQVFSAAAGGSNNSYFHQMAVVKDGSGVEWLYASWSKTWRGTGGGSRIYRSSDGTNWSLFQTFNESECWACSRGEDEYTLYVGTRQDGGHGKIYVYRVDVQPPSVPTGVTAVGQSETSIRVTWTASTDNVGVAGYKVYRDGSLVGTSAATSYIDGGLAANTTHSYTVSAYDAAGNQSAQSSPPAVGTTLPPPETEPPSVPSNVQAVPQSYTSIQVSWTASTDNVGVIGYKVFRNGVQVGSSPVPGYLDAGLTPGATYSYTVSAYDAAGNNSAQSSPPAVTSTPADTQAPSVPTNVQATGLSPSSVKITWTASSDNVGVVGYKLFRNNVQIGTAATTSYTDTGLTGGTEYSYTVSAYDGVGNESAQSSPPVVITTPAGDHSAPSVPTNVKAVAQSASSITVTWAASTDNVGVTGYKVFRNDVQIGTSATTSYSSSGLTACTTYSYTVSAYDAAGNESAKSAPVATAKTIGQTIRLCGKDFHQAYDIDGQKGSCTPNPNNPNVDLDYGSDCGCFVSWPEPTEWLQFNDIQFCGGIYQIQVSLASDRSGMQFRVRGNGNDWGVFTSWNTGGWETFATATGGTGVLTEGKYTVRVEFLNNRLNFAWVQFVPQLDTSAPSTPGSVQAAVQSDTSIRVNWTASSDNVGVVGYRIYRGSTVVATTNATTYTDTGLSPSSTYSYRVSAYDARGNESALSSPETATTTDSVPPSVPTNLQAASLTPRIIGLSWSASTDNVGVAGYRIYRDGIQIATTTATQYNDTGLLPNTAYTYTVLAYDVAGNSSGHSAPAVAATLEPLNIAACKLLSDGSVVGLISRVVTAVFPGAFYIEEIDRSMGIKIVPAEMPAGLLVGRLVDIGGSMRTASGERYIDGAVVCIVAN